MFHISSFIFLILIVSVNAQSRFTSDALLLSVKAGYHFEDHKDFIPATVYNESIPGGFSIDGTAEMHTGKNWYIGFNYDISIAKDEFYDEYYFDKVERKIAIYSFSPLIKYRVIINSASINLGFGIESTTLNTIYSRHYDKQRDGFINFNVRAGFDFAVMRNLMLSAELVYYGLGQISFHGSGRDNQFFQLKSGLTFAIPKNKL